MTGIDYEVVVVVVVEVAVVECLVAEQLALAAVYDLLTRGSLVGVRLADAAYVVENALGSCIHVHIEVNLERRWHKMPGHS